VFQLTPETEAPAEMNFFFPDHGWLCTAENCTHNDAQPGADPRRAQVRDSLKWSKYIGEMIELFGDRRRADVRLAPLAALGQRPTSLRTCVRSATCTAGCTTRRCASRTMADNAPRSPSCSPLPARVRAPRATPPATTATWCTT
jgi:hypothetical protein